YDLSPVQPAFARPSSLDSIESFEDSVQAKVPSLPGVNHDQGQSGQHHSRPVIDGRMPGIAVPRKEAAIAMSYRAAAFAEALPELEAPGCNPRRNDHALSWHRDVTWWGAPASPALHRRRRNHEAHRQSQRATPRASGWGALLLPRRHRVVDLPAAESRGGRGVPEG